MSKKNEETINVVWAADDNYAPLAGVSMASLLENNQNFYGINIWILDDHISLENKKLLQCEVSKYNATITFVDVSEYLKKIICTGARTWGNGVSYSAYSRLFIPELIKKYDIDKVLLKCYS